MSVELQKLHPNHDMLKEQSTILDMNELIRQGICTCCRHSRVRYGTTLCTKCISVFAEIDRKSFQGYINEINNLT